MNKKFYEYMITLQEGENVIHWTLEDSDKVIETYHYEKNDPSFRIEIQEWTNDDFDFIEVYPRDEGIKDLPLYVQRSINKVLEKIGEINGR